MNVSSLVPLALPASALRFTYQHNHEDLGRVAVTEDRGPHRCLVHQLCPPFMLRGLWHIAWYAQSMWGGFFKPDITFAGSSTVLQRFGLICWWAAQGVAVLIVVGTVVVNIVEGKEEFSDALAYVATSVVVAGKLPTCGELAFGAACIAASVCVIPVAASARTLKTKHKPPLKGGESTQTREA